MRGATKGLAACWSRMAQIRSFVGGGTVVGGTTVVVVVLDVVLDVVGVVPLQRAMA